MRFVGLLLFVILALPRDVFADAPPPDRRGVRYTLTVENLGDYPDHVFLIYPTTNSGFGYVLEKGKGLTNLMMRKSWKGEGSALYVMKRQDFDAHAPKPNVYPHGDEGAKVMVVAAPPDPPRALRANLPIEPPELVPLDSPVVAVERVVRIRNVEGVLELTLVRETETLGDGGTRPRVAVAPAAASAEPTTPAKPAASAAASEAPSAQRAGCGACALTPRSESSSLVWGWCWIALALVRRWSRARCAGCRRDVRAVRGLAARGSVSETRSERCRASAGTPA